MYKKALIAAGNGMYTVDQDVWERTRSVRPAAPNPERTAAVPGAHQGTNSRRSVDTFGEKEKPKKKKSKGDTAASPVSKENLAIAKSWLASSDEYNLLVNGTAITAFPVYYQNDLALLRQSLRIVQAGTEVAEVKGKDLIPAHGLAMSRLLKTSVFSTEALTYEQAIAYLRKEAIVLPPSVPKGYVLVTYKEIPLGFVKNIGNRANNLYPQEWRIRSGYLPDDIRTL